MKTNTDFAKFLSRFLSEYLPHERNMSPNTILAYRDTFVQFIGYMKDIQGIRIEKLTLDKITKDIVLGFLEWVQNKRNCSIATCNYRLAAIHSFILYLQYEDIVHLEEWQKILSIKAKKTGKKSINYLTVEAIKLLLEQPDTMTLKGRRNLALLALMYDTGARVQEIIDLTPDSINIASMPYTIRLLGKGQKYRIVPLMKEQVILLRRYMEENDLTEKYHLKHPLFFNSRGEKLTRAGVTYILKTYVIMARMINPNLIPESISCHSLRHSKAMHLLQAGVNLVYIRDILGHSSIQTTDVYTRADSKQKREALEKSYTTLIPEGEVIRLWDKNHDLLEWLKKLQK
ncbi:site-specific integrase [uncultured Bacteroides sp.]|uniref:site-specific integrase n=1 Tax=uncultured Bacteroides sp. TaxID=162156 RepID=UPI00258E4135|nr:site-specific integrase [uncultured Bacteroides sp.]